MFFLDLCKIGYVMKSKWQYAGLIKRLHFTRSGCGSELPRAAAGRGLLNQMHFFAHVRYGITIHKGLQRLMICMCMVSMAPVRFSLGGRCVHLMKTCAFFWFSNSNGICCSTESKGSAQHESNFFVVLPHLNICGNHVLSFGFILLCCMLLKA